MQQLVDQINSYVWSPALVYLCLAAGLFFSILIASPALISYGAFAAACLVGYRGNGVLLVLLAAPIIIPLLIFGVAAVDSYSVNGLGAIEFQALTGLSLIACAIALPAAAAAPR